MSVSRLSTSSQNYLKVVWVLQEWSSEPVTPTAIAARAGVRLSTASDAIRKLAGQGLLEHSPYGAVELSAEGRRLAVEMVRRHRLIETFLVEVLGYGWEQVHDEAETLEHAVSDFMVERMDEVLGHPRRDPHGDPIPGPDGQVELPDAVVLSALEPGTAGTVERISDADPGLLQFFADRGIGVGAQVEVHAGAPYSESIELHVAGRDDPLALGRPAAEMVWVSAAPR
ncbi:MAG TPA: metal-dependent transcriptional regulator [Citricoccus sp.]